MFVYHGFVPIELRLVPFWSALAIVVVLVSQPEELCNFSDKCGTIKFVIMYRGPASRRPLQPGMEVTITAAQPPHIYCRIISCIMCIMVSSIMFIVGMPPPVSSAPKCSV